MVLSKRYVPRIALRAVATIALVGLAVDANAQSSIDGWQFEATPYLWAAGMKGDAGIGKLTAEGVETSFSDLLKVLRVGFMGTLEGRKDRFGFLVDAIYLQLSQTKPARNALFGDVHATVTQQAYSAAATWRALDGNAPVDLVGGVRANYIKLDLDLAASAVASQGRTAARSRSWADGFVGARVQYPVAPQWTLVGYADVGGGGSDSTWQLLAGANYAISPTATARFGYRYLKVDYHRDDFLYDMATAGFYAGVGMRF